MREPAVEFDWNYMAPLSARVYNSALPRRAPAARAVASGNRIHGLIAYGGTWDEAVSFHLSPEARADGRGLTVDEWRWAVAFRKVLGVGSVFYEDIPANKRREVEQNTLAAANSKSAKSRRARRIITLRAIAALEEAKPESIAWALNREDMNNFLSSTSSTGHSMYELFKKTVKSDIGRENIPGKMSARVLFDGIHPTIQSILRAKDE